MEKNHKVLDMALSIIPTFISVLALIVSIVGFYPQAILGNDDYVARANAGDTDAQIFLAQHYYEVGDCDEALFWYKVAAASSDKETQMAAYNNLGCLYAQGYGLSDYENEGFRRFELAKNMFLKAVDAGSDIALENLRLLLQTTSIDLFVGEDYAEIAGGVLDAEDVLIESTSYEYSEIYRGAVYYEKNKKCVYSGTTIMPVGTATGTYYTYLVHEYEPDTEFSDYKFIYTEDE